MSLGKRARTSAIQRWVDSQSQEETYPERVTRVKFSFLQEKIFWKTDVPGSVAYTRTEVLELDDSPKPEIVQLRKQLPKVLLHTSDVSYEEVTGFLQTIVALPDIPKPRSTEFMWPTGPLPKLGILRKPQANAQ